MASRWTEADYATHQTRRGQTRRGQRSSPVTLRIQPVKGLVVIPGEPMAKPRQTQRDRWLDPPRPAVARYRAWADKARQAYGVLVKQTIGPTQLDFIAYFSMPKNWSKRKRLKMMGQPHLDKPDCDNVLKSISDALFLNDQAVYSVRGKKFWTSGESRVELVVY
jgi:Holliday junction resolvase RusA-like endonuclease